jgi:hypothetical protein
VLVDIAEGAVSSAPLLSAIKFNSWVLWEMSLVSPHIVAPMGAPSLKCLLSGQKKIKGFFFISLVISIYKASLLYGGGTLG